MYARNDTHVYSTLAKLVTKEEKKVNPDLIHHTRTIQTCKHKKIWVLSLETVHCVHREKDNAYRIKFSSHF